MSDSADGTAVKELEAATTTSELVPAHEPLLPGELHPHPSPRQYVLVAVILCIITGLEISVSYLEGDMANWIIVVLLLGMALVKFFLVASWFMHLKTDKPLYRRFFVLGGTAAVLLYLIVLATLHITLEM